MMLRKLGLRRACQSRFRICRCGFSTLHSEIQQDKLTLSQHSNRRQFSSVEIWANVCKLSPHPKQNEYAETLRNLVISSLADKDNVLAFHKEDLISLISDIQSKIQTFNPRYQADILNSFAKLSPWLHNNHLNKYKAVFQKFASFVAPQEQTSQPQKEVDLKLFDMRTLANITWAFAKVNVKHTRMLMKIATEVIQREGKGSKVKIQSISMLMWSFATFRQPHAGIYVYDT